MEQLTPCRVCQPAIFTVSCAMREAYREQFPERQPSICGGLSLGEFSAAREAGVFEFDEALRLVAERGRLMDICCQKYPGGMGAVLGTIEPAEIEALCAEHGIDVANYNCPGQIVISGEEKGLLAVMGILEERGIRVIQLNVAGAYHSRLMQSAADAFGSVLADVEVRAPRVDFLQNVTGGLVSDPTAIRGNLQSQIASSVRWESCARQICEHAESALEFGPGNVLTKFMKRISRHFNAQAPYVEPQE